MSRFTIALAAAPVLAAVYAAGALIHDPAPQEIYSCFTEDRTFRCIGTDDGQRAEFIPSGHDDPRLTGGSHEVTWAPERPPGPCARLGGIIAPHLASAVTALRERASGAGEDETGPTLEAAVTALGTSPVERALSACRDAKPGKAKTATAALTLLRAAPVIPASDARAAASVLTDAARTLNR